MGASFDEILYADDTAITSEHLPTLQKISKTPCFVKTTLVKMLKLQMLRKEERERVKLGGEKSGNHSDEHLHTCKFIFQHGFTSIRQIPRAFCQETSMPYPFPWGR